MYFQVSAMKLLYNYFGLIFHRPPLSVECLIFTRCSFPVSPSNRLLQFYFVDLSFLKFHGDSSFLNVLFALTPEHNPISTAAWPWITTDTEVNSLPQS